jgi:hypothetical protein
LLHEWFWTPLGALIVLVLYQQFRIYQIRRDGQRREELFQIVTENAADGQPPGRRRYFANEDCQEPPKLEFDLLLLWDVFRDHHLCLRCGGMSGACGAGYIP